MTAQQMPTPMQALPYRVQACPQSDIVPRWSTHYTLEEAQARAMQFKGVAGWHHVQIRDPLGNVVWDRDRDGFAALTAAQGGEA